MVKNYFIYRKDGQEKEHEEEEEEEKRGKGINKIFLEAVLSMDFP